MVRLFTDRRMLEHIPPPRHPERPERLQAIIRHLERTGLMASCPAGTVREATDDELTRVHSPAYLDLVERFEARGGLIEADTALSSGSHRAARLAAGAAVEAVADVVGGPGRRALCLVRPPGHHARPHQAMGFCLFNSVASAAADARDRHEVDRILIVDFDVHHGNGTQEIFYNDGRVAFLSIHRFPFYPGSGDLDETGTGRGLGFTTNVPLPYGIDRRDFHAAFTAALDALADKIRPELVLISAGFDAHAEDPVGDLGLEEVDFDRLTRAIVDVAETHAHGRIVSVLEGGYNVSRLAGCVEVHLRALGGGSIPAPGGTHP